MKWKVVSATFQQIKPLAVTEGFDLSGSPWSEKPKLPAAFPETGLVLPQNPDTITYPIGLRVPWRQSENQPTTLLVCRQEFQRGRQKSDAVRPAWDDPISPVLIQSWMVSVRELTGRH